MAVIVNADDFGISEEVNLAICKAFEEGLIDRTTLMTNMPFAKQAMDMAVQNGFADKVGIHLNLTAGIPLTDEMRRDRVMCDEDGAFTADFARNMRTRLFLGADSSDAVAKEIRAQLDKYEELGGSLWHIDSHHHVHTDPSIWRILKKIIPEYPIKSVRLGRNLYRGGNIMMRVYKLIFNASVRRKCKLREDMFGSAEDMHNYTAAMTESDRKKWMDSVNIEIMVHPMFNDNNEISDSMESELKKAVDFR